MGFPPQGSASPSSIAELLAKTALVPSLLETWQDQVGGIDPLIWTATNPATGTAWAIIDAGTHLCARSAPNANENCRIRCIPLWPFSPSTFTASNIYRRLTIEFMLQISAGLANLNNATTLWGITWAVGDTRATNDVTGFTLVGAGNALQVLTDIGGVETVNTGFGETLTNWNKFKIDVVNGTNIRFYLNEVLLATHANTLVGQAMVNFYTATGAGGAATFRLGPIRISVEDIVRP